MGLGLSITLTEGHWPEEEIRVVCMQCGSVLLLTRFRRIFEAPVPSGETEQYCPQCGTAACEEDEGVKTIAVKNRSQDFFSAFRK